jgi:hypothetical protein
MRPTQKVETYPDGILDVYERGDGRTTGDKLATLRFENKTIGIQRYFDAQNSVKSYIIALVLKVHHTALFNELDIVAIGDRQYRIRKIQYIPERGVDLLELESVKVTIKAATPAPEPTPTPPNEGTDENVQSETDGP